LILASFSLTVTNDFLNCSVPNLPFPMNASNIQLSQHATASPLSGVLTSARDDLVVNNNRYRRYMAVLTSYLPLCRGVDASAKHITHRVGPRQNIGNGAIETYGEGATQLSCAVRVPTYAAADFASSARKYANFAGDFSTMDLCALVERLAMGMVRFANSGALTLVQLAGGAGNVPRVSVLGAAGPPITAGSGTIFIPRAADAPTSPNVFAAIVYAAAAFGSRVVTDWLEVDQNGRAVLPNIGGSDLAYGCYHALRIIGGNYAKAERGAVFAYAVTCGIHRDLTVVGHTDEGAYLRKVLRTGGFQAPFGGIDVRCRDYVGLPRPAEGTPGNFAQLVDTIALTTAAAAACCDPLVQVDGRLYPTHFVSARVAATEPGATADVPDDELDAIALEHATSICGIAGQFSRAYIKALARLFLADASGSEAEVHLVTKFQMAASAADRHLQYVSVAPFFWIEPTGLVDLPSTEFPAVAAGYGQLCSPTRPSKMPFWDDVFQTTCDMGCVSYGRVGWRSARTSGLVLHLNGHLLNGLTSLIIRQADPYAFNNVGGADEGMSARMLASRDVATMLWVRGHSPICAPAEAMYVGKGLGIQVVHSSYDAEEGRIKLNHVPDSSEFFSGEVSLYVSRFSPLGTGGLDDPNRVVHRARTSAYLALNGARHALAPVLPQLAMAVSFSDGGGTDWSTMPRLPLERPLDVTRAAADADSQRDGDGRVHRAAIVDNVPGTERQGDTGAPAGDRIHATTLLAPQTGARARRQRAEGDVQVAAQGDAGVEEQ
jgi:hypothetical protein